MVLRLRIPMKQRLGIAAIFALGFLVVFASCEIDPSIVHNK